MEDINGYAEALTALNAHLTPRSKKLQTFERHVSGTQYEGLDDFFSDDKPLWERAPCIVYPIVKLAIDSHADLLLGEGRFPSFKVEGAEGEEAANFEKVVARVGNLARLKAAAHEIFESAQGCGSACAIFSVTGNRLKIQSVYARWCTPEFDDEGAVIALEIRYPYLQIVTEHREQRVVCKLYRRTIDAISDIEYAPVVVTPDSDPTKEPSWSPVVTTVHGLGFCPVVWYAHLRSCAIVNDYDGSAIHRYLLDEIRAHDFALSQRHRAALYAGDPQWTEIGVRKGYDPAGSAGRKAILAPVLAGIPREGEVSLASYIGEAGAGTGRARKKGPGVVWQYDSQDASKVKVELHSLPGDALKVIDDHARDLKGKLAEALGVVLLDASSLPNESRLSGKALTDLKAPQLARVDSYRDDFGDHFLVPALGMLLRIALATALDIEGLEVVRPFTTAKTWSWHFPPLHVSWGAYFPPSGEEELAIIQGVMAANGAKPVLTLRQSVEKLAGLLGIKDVDAYMSELEAETAAQEKKDLVKIEAEAKATAAAKPKPAPAARTAA